jgi:hypothetical protein
MTPTARDPELAAVLELLRAKGGALVNVGHGRSAADTRRAAAFVDAWEWSCGLVGTVVSWPERPASWLQPACRLAAGGADAWLIADTPRGWAGIGRRLASMAGWTAHRTVAFSGLADADLPTTAGAEATEGLSGAGGDGAIWVFVDGRLRWSGPPDRGPT